MIPEQVLALMTVIANLQLQYEQMRGRYDLILKEKDEVIKRLEAEILAKEIEVMEDQTR